MILKYSTNNNLVFDFYFNFENFKKALNIKSYSLPSFDSLWSDFRRKYCPTRILQYGSISRGIVGDDRTRFEKFCDYISDYLFERKQKIRFERSEPHRRGFHYFDWGFGKKITNMDEVHELERRSGKTLVSWKDQEVEQAKIQRQMIVDEKAKIAQKIHHVFSEVQKGRSYRKEMQKDKEDFRGMFNGRY